MKKELCVKLVIYKVYTVMRGQQNIKKITGTLHEDQYTFMTISCSFVLRMRNVSVKSYRGNQNTQFIFILFIPAVLTKYIQVWNSHKTQL